MRRSRKLERKEKMRVDDQVGGGKSEEEGERREEKPTNTEIITIRVLCCTGYLV